MNKSRPALAVAFVMGVLASSYECNVIQWQTKLGNITGNEEVFLNQTIYTFKKIPFAKPPIGELRFAKPQPVKSWKGTLNATTFGPFCWQTHSAGENNLSEDCLYLNIYIPNEMSPKSSRGVMVWIHGGSFSVGTGITFDGRELALHGNVIVVTINYRLNVFGFFTTGNVAAHGNFGIWDQREAIVWVKNNIAEFGGNPEQITVFGESAGGVSVSLQIVTPKNLGLFQRAIQESGSFLGPRDFAVESVKTSIEITKILSCAENGTYDDLLKCVRNRSATDLFNAYSYLTNQHDTFSIRIRLGPVSDGDLIPYNIRKLIADPSSEPSRMFSSIDYMGGNTDGEAGLFFFDLLPFQKRFKFNVSLGIPSRVLCKNVVPAIAEEIYKNCTAISDAICDIYSPKEKNTTLQTQTQMASDMYGYFVKVSPIVKLLNYHAMYSKKPTYQYMFTHKPNKGVMLRPVWLKGANHVDELPFVVGFRSWYKNYNGTPEELALSSRVMTYWTNFAKYGDPNSNGTSLWPKYEISNKLYMNLNITDSIETHLWRNRMTFWTTMVPQLEAGCSGGTGGVSTSHRGITDTSKGVKETISVQLLTSSIIMTVFLIIYD